MVALPCPIASISSVAAIVAAAVGTGRVKQLELVLLYAA